MDLERPEILITLNYKISDLQELYVDFDGWVNKVRAIYNRKLRETTEANRDKYNLDNLQLEQLYVKGVYRKGPNKWNELEKRITNEEITNNDCVLFSMLDNKGQKKIIILNKLRSKL